LKVPFFAYAPELLESHTLDELAQTLFTSSSTLIRLAQKLGFQGFREFKQAIAQLSQTESLVPSNNLMATYQFFCI
jgi:DNA-binding MurR/RpiR family transcriptional regulator